MKNVKSITLLLLATIIFASCKKDPNSVKPDNRITPPTAEQYLKLREIALKKQIQKFTIDLDTLTGHQINLISQNGTEIRLYKGLLRIGNEEVTGKIDIDFIELYDAGHMLITNKTTMGLDANGNLVPIITGGAFYLNISKNGQFLDGGPTSYELTVPGKLTGGVDRDMILWSGETDSVGNLTWKTIDVNRAKVHLGFEDSSYTTLFDRYGWTNIDKFASYDGPKTKLGVRVPDGFNNTNSIVYLKYKGEPNALARLDTYENDTKLFTEHYGWLPVGEECHLIFSSQRSDGKWMIGIKSNITIAANQVYEIKDSDTQLIDTDAEVTQMINALP